MMKEFNLEQALAGAKVCTRDGREVTQLKLFDGVTYGLVGVIQGNLYTWAANGTADTGPCRDLFMAPVKKTGWVTRWGAWLASGVYGSEEEAKKAYPHALSYHEIEWED
jgi:hypothetical protein